jgi:hypothetical protein
MDMDKLRRAVEAAKDAGISYIQVGFSVDAVEAVRSLGGEVRRTVYVYPDKPADVIVGACLHGDVQIHAQYTDTPTEAETAEAALSGNQYRMEFRSSGVPA